MRRKNLVSLSSQIFSLKNSSQENFHSQSKVSGSLVTVMDSRTYCPWLDLLWALGCLTTIRCQSTTMTPLSASSQLKTTDTTLNRIQMSQTTRQLLSLYTGLTWKASKTHSATNKHRESIEDRVTHIWKSILAPCVTVWISGAWHPKTWPRCIQPTLCTFQRAVHLACKVRKGAHRLFVVPIRNQPAV